MTKQDVLKKKQTSDRPVATSVLRRTIGRCLVGNQRRLERIQRRLEGNQRRLKATVVKRNLSTRKRPVAKAPFWGNRSGEGGGFGLWACLPDPKRALGAHGVPRFGEVRLRRTALTLVPSGARAGYTPPSADVLVLAWCKGLGARGTQGTESGSCFFTGSVLESVACEPQPRPIGARDAGWPECSWVQVA